MTELTKREQDILDFILSPDVKNIALGLEFMKKRSTKSRKAILENFLYKHIGNAGKLFELSFIAGEREKDTRVLKYKGWFGAKYFAYSSQYTRPFEFWTVRKYRRILPFFKDQEVKEEEYHECYYFQYEITNDNDEYHLVRGDKAWVRLFLALQHLVNHLVKHDY